MPDAATGVPSSSNGQGGLLASLPRAQPGGSVSTPATSASEPVVSAIGLHVGLVVCEAAGLKAATVSALQRLGKAIHVVTAIRYIL